MCRVFILVICFLFLKKGEQIMCVIGLGIKLLQSDGIMTL